MDMQTMSGVAERDHVIKIVARKVYSQEHTHVLVCWDSLKTVYMYLLMLSY